MAEWAEWVWLNGRLVRGAEASVSVFDRSFLLGDGVFETLRARRGHLFRLNQHLARLREGMSRFHLSTLWDDQALYSAGYHVLDANHLQDAALRLTVSRGVGSAGPMPLAPGPATVVIAARPFAGYSPEWFDTGMSATISPVIKNERSPLCGVKSTSYGEHLLARFDAIERKKDEALLMNTQGHLSEASSSNLFAVNGGRLCTPDLSSGCLPGITRAAVLDVAREAGVEVSEGPLLPATVAEWQEAFLTNSLLGVAPLVRVDDQAVGTGRPGPVTQRLAQQYEELVIREIGQG